MHRRRVSITPKTGLGEPLLIEMRENAVSRMRVYDAAPKSVRLKTHEEGDPPLVRWWNRLQEHQQIAILEGRKPGKRKPKEELDWRELMADWVLRR